MSCRDVITDVITHGLKLSALTR